MDNNYNNHNPSLDLGAVTSSNLPSWDDTMVDEESGYQSFTIVDKEELQRQHADVAKYYSYGITSASELASDHFSRLSTIVLNRLHGLQETWNDNILKSTTVQRLAEDAISSSTSFLSSVGTDHHHKSDLELSPLSASNSTMSIPFGSYDNHKPKGCPPQKIQVLQARLLTVEDGDERLSLVGSYEHVDYTYVNAENVPPPISFRRV
jgi:hypothetical protein